jgi:hypothetical protein
MKYATPVRFRMERRFVCLAVLAFLVFATGNVLADAKDDLASRKSEWERTKQQMDDVAGQVRNYLDDSKSLRQLDKADLKELITKICGISIARDDDEGDRLAKEMTEKMVADVTREYDRVDSAGRHVEEEADRVLGDAKTLRDNTKDLMSDDDVKEDATQLMSEMSATIDAFTNDTWSVLSADYKALENIKDGVPKGTNNPRIRAAVEYGKEKHTYNQRICEEKEVVLSSGRPDCVSFQKDACAVWEFKPDSTFTDEQAAEWAKKYVEDVQTKFKDDSRAKENCKKDADGNPIFEAKGAVYPACSPSGD